MLIEAVQVQIAVALPVSGTFTYEASPSISHLISLGKRVMVPFGKRMITGYVLDVGPVVDRCGLKQVVDVLDETPLFPASMIPFFKWIADYYKHPIGEVIQCALPAGLTLNDVSRLRITEMGTEALLKASLSPLEREILNRLKDGPCDQRTLDGHFGQKVPRVLIHSLLAREWIEKAQTIKDVSPKHRYERCVCLLNPEAVIDPRAKTRYKVIEILKNTGTLRVSELQKILPTAANVLKPLCEAGHIRIHREKVFRDPFGEDILPEADLALTGEQAAVVDEIEKAMGKGYATFLLSGVTGSGKTEVYLQLARKAVEEGRQALILVPEIALISQIERRFRARFGEGVAVLHSGLSHGERFDQWIRILLNQAPIVIGARSAVFAPLDRIGLIIVDEEHETSYKQDHGLMYQARDLSVKRASLEGCVAVLGSATPSIQSFYNVETGKYREVRLTRRVNERPLAEVRLVDLRKIKDKRGIRRFISPELHEAMKNTLERKEQVLLFLNRRGFSNISVCGSCGEAIKCRNCDIAMTLHHHTRAYSCHYCGSSRAASMDCSVCGSSHIRHLGIGTEKVEQAVRALFPEAGVVRMDRDTTRRKGSIVQILKGLQNREIDILVGTQMVAKGHDFPNITLVGIICADLSLGFPDFRSGVKTFQVLAQVAGRAGRGEAPGKVILQTYNPGHFSISAATRQDFRAFYDQDIRFRQSLKYPPFSRLIRLRISGKNADAVRDHALKIGCAAKVLAKSPPFDKSVSVLGPIESSLSRIAGHYRWQILLKGTTVSHLHLFARELLDGNTPLFRHAQVSVKVDVDPYFMM